MPGCPAGRGRINRSLPRCPAGGTPGGQVSASRAASPPLARALASCPSAGPCSGSLLECWPRGRPGPACATPTSLFCSPRGCSDVEGDKTSKLNCWALWHPWARQPAFDQTGVASPGCRAWKPRRAQHGPCGPNRLRAPGAHAPEGRAPRPHRRQARGCLCPGASPASAAPGRTRSSHGAQPLSQTCGPGAPPLSRSAAGTTAGPPEQGCRGAGGRASLPFPTGRVPARTPESCS